MKPVRQEERRFTASNAESLTTHFATLARLIKEFDLDASRNWKLDETGGTPGKYFSGACASRRFLRRDGIMDANIPHFANLNSSTMIHVVSASGDKRPPLSVFKGNIIPYRTLLRGGYTRVETLADYLPRGAVIACCE